MAVGFQSWDDAGREQITESMYCLSLRAKASVEAVLNFEFGPGQKYYDIVVQSATYPVVAIYSLTATTSIMYVRKEGTTWTFTVVSIAGDNKFTYYVFDKPENKPTTGSGFGFEVRNGAGEIVWDSNQPVFPLVGTTDYDGYTGVAGHKYAHVHASRARYEITTIIDTFAQEYTYWSMFLSGFRSTNNGLISQEYQIAAGGNSGSQGPSSIGSVGGVILVLDVTNL